MITLSLSFRLRQKRRSITWVHSETEVRHQAHQSQVEAIAAVDGIDVLFVGPWDLGNNLGFPVTGDFAPELKEAILRILKAAKAAGKKAGIYCPNGDFARKYADEGFQMVCIF